MNWNGFPGISAGKELKTFFLLNFAGADPQPAAGPDFEESSCASTCDTSSRRWGGGTMVAYFSVGLGLLDLLTKEILPDFVQDRFANRRPKHMDRETDMLISLFHHHLIMRFCKI